MNGAILVLNAGSSSLKFSLFETGRGEDGFGLVSRGAVGGLGSRPRFVVTDASGRPLVDEAMPTGPGAPQDHAAALGRLLEWIRGHRGGLTIQAAGHRVVHGGARFVVPVAIDAGVVGALEALVPLAPLHQPHNLAAIRALARLDPALPQVACFDTAFHATQPWAARTFALPRALTDAGLVRYGFHGLSFESIASALPPVVGEGAEGRVVVAHLGAGASLCAMRGRRSVATTMSLTPLDGLPMGTRCGALDPGLVLHLMDARGMAASEVSDLLYHRSGLLGVSGLSSDMRDLLASESPAAAQAVELFVYRIGRELGSQAAALGGVDVLVFTGGIGEHAAPIRARVCRQAEWLGVRLDEAANRRGGPRITTPESPVSAWVIPTDEERVIARHTASLLEAGRGSAERT